MFKNIGNMAGLMKQAQEMQEKMAKMQEDIEAIEVAGSSGGDMVQVTLAGKGTLKAVKIDPSLLNPDESEILEDLIVAAHADAKDKLEQRVQEEMQKLTGGMELPEGFKLPGM